MASYTDAVLVHQQSEGVRERRRFVQHKNEKRIASDSARQTPDATEASTSSCGDGIIKGMDA